MPKFKVHVAHIGAPKDGVAIHREGVMEVEANDPAHAREMATSNLKSGTSDVTFGPDRHLNVADDGSMSQVMAVHAIGPKMQVPKTPGASLAAPSTVAAPPVARGVNDEKLDEREDGEKQPEPNPDPKPPAPKTPPTHELT